MKRPNRKDLEKIFGCSHALGYKIYKTKYPDLFLSEIDFTSGRSLIDKNILHLVYTGNMECGRIIFSRELLEDAGSTNSLIDYYYNKIINGFWWAI